jgi:RNA polymerase sigma factor (sigma-70 family)
VAGEPLGDVLRRLGRSEGIQGDLTQTDAELLERFARRRDEPAFAALVVRHGPMVLGVCRRLLPDDQEAEDAFQAAFLVLARKAAAIRRRPLLGAWLYGVACRVASRLRGQAARRRSHERLGVDFSAVGVDDPAWSDVAPLLHEEVRRLPGYYRDPIVLCFLEGKTNEEAAVLLQRPVGTIKSRLTRARELLRTRLARRGVGCSAVALAAGLAVRPATASAFLRESTTQAAVQFASRGAATTARAAMLARSVLRVGWGTKAALIGAALSVVLLGAGGVGLAVRGWPSAPPVAGAPAPKADAAAIQAEWRIVCVEYLGQDVTDKDAFREMKKQTWRFEKDQILVENTGAFPSRTDYTLDSTVRPKHLDLLHMGGKDAKTILAIYDLSGDDLKIHLPSPGNPERPTEFVTKEGVVTLLLTFHREA